ncbi:UDP-forming cellulose synthase catalytic subunit [Aliivibrio fischeri]|uniref:UDP-forming cellulose synthase catalytic subunit n=1 Tax=Aliivibrio fischeri TaxID=668 RepID=UPI001F421C6F|nr:UDP-forming cellulose synthase catalytic subunit [Aliivibrio fischeri]MCE7565446.1 UDP-forming cellulose synthase catalytic subunit [Aliivibrio fischeri]
MFGWLSFLFQPRFAKEFRLQLNFYTQDKVATGISQLVLSLWFFICFCFLKPTILNVDSWKLPHYLFPQIDFSQLKFLDPLRMCIQLVWIILVVQPKKMKQNISLAQWVSYLWGQINRIFYFPLKGLTSVVAWLENYSKYSEVRKKENANKHRAIVSERVINVITGIAVCMLALLCFTIPFSLTAQAFFIFALWSLGMMFRRMPGKFPTILLITLSVTVSCRYIWWRYTSSLNWDDPLALFLGCVLLMAETYAWIVLILGYFQNIWPLNRQPASLPEDQSLWPTIDMMIPTYNEDLDVVRATVYSALGVDWPKEKLNIFILDDGKRDSFKEFAKEVGVGYIRRPTNEHAKAGNINYALKHTSGEFVAIFDCDHIPTRAFFQLTMGWFLKDKKLGLIQTPHHFFSPDPFERNLSNFGVVPNEGSLFYGLIQDGNDLWDASFFCGSCAVLRREPLEEVGGIAVETVTEDAHTSLRMHRLGYRSAYLRKPLSAGLATETLSAHIGQRIRWARGMAQIFRVDNPLLGKGLKWQQRLCYANAMLHFLSGIPRIIFLLAPLVFLIMHTYIIYAPALAIILYVLPHMVHASMTNSRMQGEYRYSFWGEVYETVLSWYIARPTTVALFAPHKGTFNVTAKGGLIEETHYDWSISKPYWLLVILNVLGIGFGLYRLGWGPGDELGSVVVNLLWVFYNLLILGGAVAVAEESKQVRKDHRVVVNIPMSIHLSSGHKVRCDIKDFSLGGLRVELPVSLDLPSCHSLNIALQRGEHHFVFPTTVSYSNGKALGLQLEPLTKQQNIDYVQCTFARADIWSKWQKSYRSDKPLSSMLSVFKIGAKGYKNTIAYSPKTVRSIVKLITITSEFLLTFKPKKVNFQSAISYVD